MGPEILAPAGDVDKLVTAFHFGADSVYVGLKRHSLRNFARNFDFGELEFALHHAHDRGGKVYVALNLLPYDDDLEEMVADIRELGKLQPDGLIIADPGVLALVKQEAPSLALHLSTQANVTNAPSARFWYDQGIQRIVVARELGMDRLAKLVANVPGEVEAFVHGAVCISYSGRCFLSHYWTGRDANRGECAQACRWKYREVEEQRREGEHHYLMEDDRYTYFFDARDLCALPVLPQLYATGVAAWKIEGRMKSQHYVAVTTDVYQQAAKWLAAGETEQFLAKLPDLQKEVARVSNREFSTHFLPGGVPDLDSYNKTGSTYRNAGAFIGTVVTRSEHFVDVRVKNKLQPGEHLELRDRGLVREPLPVGPLFQPDGTALDRGLPGTVVRIPGNFKSDVGAIVRALPD
jgi:U32 family peptidase